MRPKTINLCPIRGELQKTMIVISLCPIVLSECCKILLSVVVEKAEELGFCVWIIKNKGFNCENFNSDLWNLCNCVFVTLKD